MDARDRGLLADWQVTRFTLVAALATLSFAACSSDGASSASTPTRTATEAPATPSRTATQLPPAATSTPSSTSTPTDTPTTTPSPEPQAEAFRISGHLASFDCQGDAEDGTVVTLQPEGRITTTTAGSFVFEDVPPGDYLVTVDDDCGAFPCYADLPVSVIDGDETADLCYDLCPTPLIDPAFGLPGSTATIEGRCYEIHSGRSGYVFFDQRFIGEVRGDTPGNYSLDFVIPVDAAPGEYVISLGSNPESADGARASATFVVLQDVVEDLRPQPFPQHASLDLSLAASARR